MKRVSSLIVCAVLMILGVAQPVSATTGSKATPFFQQNRSPDDQEIVRMFSGTIVLQETGQYVLQSDSDKLTYGLDNQVIAEKYVGKKVVVTGTLDKTAMIHVKNIELRKA